MTRWPEMPADVAPVPGRKEDVMTEIDLTPEAVERLARECNALAFDLAELAEGRILGRARDTLRALSVELADVEAGRSAMEIVLEMTAQSGAFNARTAENATARAEAAEAALATARADALREVLALPYREERLGGQRHNYVRVEEVRALIPQEKPHE
jgi:hypothetical protein